LGSLQEIVWTVLNENDPAKSCQPKKDKPEHPAEKTHCVKLTGSLPDSRVEGRRGGGGHSGGEKHNTQRARRFAEVAEVFFEFALRWVPNAYKNRTYN
jgi:hypothetical protein